MRFEPLSDAELAAQRGTLKPGPADFEVIDAKEALSKAGNEMVKLTLRVWDSEGRQGQLFDYLLGNAQWKIKSFYQSIGNPEAYEAGLIDPLNLSGASGKAILTIQKDPKYGDQVRIQNYVMPGVKKETKEAKDPDSIRDEGDDVPF